LADETRIRVAKIVTTGDAGTCETVGRDRMSSACSAGAAPNTSTLLPRLMILAPAVAITARKFDVITASFLSPCPDSCNISPGRRPIRQSCCRLLAVFFSSCISVLCVVRSREIGVIVRLVIITVRRLRCSVKVNDEPLLACDAPACRHSDVLRCVTSHVYYLRRLCRSALVDRRCFY